MSVSRLEIEAERGEAAERSNARLQFQAAGQVIATAKPTAWLIRGVLEVDTLATLIGEPGTFKSFLAIDWAAHIATGIDWHGHRVERRPVLIVAGEGHGGIGRRLIAWERANSVSLRDAGLFVSNRPAPINVAEGFDAVARAIDELRGVEPGLILVDTMARNFRGDENSAADVGAFVAAMDELRRPTKATAMVVHHSGIGSAERGRGSTALYGAVDWQWLAAREPDCTAFRCTKSKDSELPPPFAMRAESIDIGMRDPHDGSPITSAVLRPTAMPAAREKGSGANQQRAMAALRKLYANARANLVKQGRDPDGALIDIASWKEAADLDRKRFAEVKTALSDRGLVIVDGLHVRLPAS